MSRRMRIPRGDPEERRGVWKPANIDGKRTARLSCPACGKIASLDDHALDANGSVSPSVVCGEDCGFHEYIILESFS